MRQVTQTSAEALAQVAPHAITFEAATWQMDAVHEHAAIFTSTDAIAPTTSHETIASTIETLAFTFDAPIERKRRFRRHLVRKRAELRRASEKKRRIPLQRRA